MLSVKSRSSTWYMQAVSIPIFLLIFTVGLYQVITDDKFIIDTNATTISDFSMKYGMVLNVNSTCIFEVTEDPCTIKCFNTHYQKFIEDLKTASNNVHICTEGVKLQLVNITFPNNTLNEGWLADIPLSLQSLEISKNLEELGPRAFTGPPFQMSISLTINDCGIRTLRKHTFEDAKIYGITLTRCFSNGMPALSAEEGALDEIADSLAIIKIQNCSDDPEMIRNILGKGSKSFTVLWHVDLQRNKFNKLLSNSFVNVKKLLMLFLNSGRINEIELSAFFGIEHTISLLQLNSNNLTTFSEGLFDNFKMRADPAIIDIQQNKWECRCGLEWFKEFFYCYRDKYFKGINFICNTGEDYMDVKFCPWEFKPPCGSKESTTDIPTTRATTVKTTATPAVTTTTEFSRSTKIPATTTSVSASSKFTTIIPTTEDTNVIQCSPAEYITETAELSVIQKTYSVKNRDISYCFKQYSEHSFIIHIEGKVYENEFLMWTNVDNKSDYGCKYNITEQENILMDNLSAGKSYVVCLMEIVGDVLKTSTSNIQDCTALAVPVEYNARAWIVNKYKVYVLSGIVVGIVFTALLTSFFVYFLIKSNPQLISSKCKEVIVQKKSCKKKSKKSSSVGIFNEQSSIRPQSSQLGSFISYENSTSSIEHQYESPTASQSNRSFLPFKYTFYSH